MTDKSNPLLLSISGATYHIGASEQVIRRAIRNGALKAYLLGPRCIRIWPEDMEDWIKRSVKPLKPDKAERDQFQEA